jgi:hypothetical protein
MSPIECNVINTNQFELIGTQWRPKNRQFGNTWKCTDVYHSIGGRVAVQLEKYQGGRNSPAIITTKKLRQNFNQITETP